MAVAMDAYGMPLIGNPLCHLGIFFHILPNEEKGCLYVFLLQDIQYLFRIFFRRAVVKGQVHGTGMKVQVNSLCNALRYLILIFLIGQLSALLRV
ncbi:hypothetical protein IMSAG249_01959 [Lachnospiraceae bacterium]|nr:hypothetical protein IMSAG249_01959 [Lachnospiraceae bacterium]